MSNAAGDNTVEFKFIVWPDRDPEHVGELIDLDTYAFADNLVLQPNATYTIRIKQDFSPEMEF
jgi:hypothetical protein